MEQPKTIEEAKLLLEVKRAEIASLEARSESAIFSERKATVLVAIGEALKQEGCTKIDVLLKNIDKDDVLRDVDGVVFPFLDGARADADDVARHYRTEIPELFAARQVDESQSADSIFLDELADLR